jgi:hypothetical protein
MSTLNMERWHLTEIGEQLALSREGTRRALGSLLLRCADAVEAVAKVSDGDWPLEDETKAIYLALGSHADKLILAEVVAHAEALLSELRDATARARGVLG